MNLGPMEIGLLLFVMMFAFGPKRIPEIGKAVGEALSGFRKATRDETDVKPVAEAKRADVEAAPSALKPSEAEVIAESPARVL